MRVIFHNFFTFLLLFLESQREVTAALDHIRIHLVPSLSVVVRTQQKIICDRIRPCDLREKNNANVPIWYFSVIRPKIIERTVNQVSVFLLTAWFYFR